MLSIPEEIKQAIKNDSALINVRVVFVNGEHADITNEQIVDDSVTFTESICSGDSLSLGLMESPTFEFTARDIPNIKGMKIQVFYEYYCESTVQNAVYKADLGHYVYQLPIGLFTVQNSPKETDMDFRKVTAYASVIDDSLTMRTDFIKALNVPWFNKSTPVRVHIDDLEKMNFFNDSIINEAVTITSRTIEEAVGNTTEAYNFEATITGFYIERDKLHDYDGTFMYENMTYSENQFNYWKFNGNWQAYNTQISEFLAEALNVLNGWNITPEMRERAMPVLRKIMYPIIEINTPLTYNHVVENYSGSTYSGGTQTGRFLDTGEEVRNIEQLVIRSPKGCVFNSIQKSFEKKGSSKWVYNEYKTDNAVFIPLTISLDIQNILTYPLVHETITVDYSTNLDGVYTKEIKQKYTFEEDTDLYRIDFNRTLETKKTLTKITYNSGGSVTGHSTVHRVDYSADIAEFEAVEIRDLMASMAELQGKLGRINRYGEFELVTLNSSSGLTPSATLVPANTLYPGGANGGTVFPINYISCWYEELKLEQFGQINLTFRDAENEGNEAEYIYYIDGGGNRTYTIENNAVLQNCLFTKADIDAMIATMAANMTDIQYIPCDIELIGRPELECGDFIQILTAEGQALKTIIFRRTLRGTQLLMDNIEVNATEDGSKSGSRSGGSTGSSGAISGVKSVNGYTGDVALTMADIPNNYFEYEHDSATKTLKIHGFRKHEEDET